MPLISVITINLNNCSGLSRTICSINNQSLLDIEHVIIDGNSTDGSIELLNCQNKPNRKILIGRDEGIFDAMNKGLLAAEGEYVIFINSGDVLYSNTTLAEAQDTLKEGHSLICGLVEITVGGKKSGVADLGEWIPHQGAFIKRELHMRFQYDKNLKVFGDLDLWMRLKEVNEFKVLRLPIIVAQMEMDGIGNHPKFLKNRLIDKVRLRKKHKQWVRLLADMTWLTFSMLIFRVFGQNGYQICIRCLSLFRKAWHHPWDALSRVCGITHSLLMWPARAVMYKRIGFISFIHPLSSIKNFNTTSIGSGSAINRGAVLWCSKIAIGDESQINPNVVIYGKASIGNFVMIGPGTVIAGGSHCFNRRDLPMKRQGATSTGVVIDDDVWIGANAVITDGVHIHRGAIVGAGAVVTRDVPAWAIVQGVPASVTRYRPEDSAQ